MEERLDGLRYQRPDKIHLWPGHGLLWLEGQDIGDSDIRCPVRIDYLTNYFLP